MSTTDHHPAAAPTATAPTTTARAATARTAPTSAAIAPSRDRAADAATEGTIHRGFVFWIVRYLPAEVVGTAAMVIGGVVATMWTDVPALIAVGALLGEIVGFYVVLAVTVFIEQVHVAASWRRAAGRTILLLAAEFGAAEVLDTFLVRPVALTLGVWLFPDPMLGMIIGKIGADIVFYAVAAGAFTVTARVGLREGRLPFGAREVTP